MLDSLKPRHEAEAQGLELMAKPTMRIDQPVLIGSAYKIEPVLKALKHLEAQHRTTETPRSPIEPVTKQESHLARLLHKELVESITKGSAPEAQRYRRSTFLTQTEGKLEVDPNAIMDTEYPDGAYVLTWQWFPSANLQQPTGQNDPDLNPWQKDEGVL
jgi:hypothetical protein